MVIGVTLSSLTWVVMLYFILSDEKLFSENAAVKNIITGKTRKDPSDEQSFSEFDEFRDLYNNESLGGVSNYWQH